MFHQRIAFSLLLTEAYSWEVTTKKKRHVILVCLLLLLFILSGCIVIVSINSPLDAEQFAVGDTITFNGSATSSGVELTGNALVWTSEIDGQIGTGTEFTRNDLSEGIHTISFTTRDAWGFQG